jgi:hypothetical protein
MPKPIVYTKESLIEKFKAIEKMGWIPNGRHGNVGGIGNTLEDLLGIKENNLPIANAAEWELKTQRVMTSSLTTLFHMEPSPQAVGFVSNIFLPKYGWAHKEAGKKYGKSEMSFRQTIHGETPSDRGFMVKINRTTKKVSISFNSKKVDPRHKEWLVSVKKRVGNLNELDPEPYWGFDDLKNKAGTKLLNCFYVQAEVLKKDGKEFYHYGRVLMLRKFNFEGFLDALDDGNILVDFDARSGHNHGTKFRLRQDCLPRLYEEAKQII